MLPTTFWLSLAASLIFVLSGALGLQLVPVVGLYGRKRAERLARQPFVDLVVFGMVALPWAVCWIIAGLPGLFGSFAGQVLGALAWSVLHTQSQPRHQRGPSMIKALATRVGTFRTYTAMWLSLAALPMLIAMRALQIAIWPVFARLLGLPREPHARYLSFTRHSAKGIAGLDLLWAVYSEWAVGVWSLSGQMMRHAASLFAPMRFADDAKNKACSIDFPDIEQWSEPGSLEGAGRLIEQMHAPGNTAWFGHESRKHKQESTPAPEQKAA